MNLTLTSDQAAVVAALDQLAGRFEVKPADFHGFALPGEDLEEALEDGQFFEMALVPELGPLCAAMAVERLARLPYTAEIALSMLVRPHLPSRSQPACTNRDSAGNAASDLGTLAASGASVPRPLALIENNRPGRFVANARTVLVLNGESIGIARPAMHALEPANSIYAYPMGRLNDPATVEPFSQEDATSVRKWLRVALAAEISGLLHAAIDTTVEHVNDRKQFGRPLATFQAIRHRLAECAVLAGGVRWLAFKAAWTRDEGDAALAALHAQQSAIQVVYDVHQMFGGMGITLEHSLHLWTYRLKALISELGGRGGHASDVARYCFD